jgi:hypothetical protein
MRRSDKKANIAEANRLAEEAFMKEREMMGISSPVKEEAPEIPEYTGQPSYDIEGAVNLIVENKIKGVIEEMSSSEILILFETENFSLHVNCDVEVDEYPSYTPGSLNNPAEGSSGGLIPTITGGVMNTENDEEISVTAEQLKPLEKMIDDIINDSDNLNDYFEDGSDESDYDDQRDDRFDAGMASKESGEMYEEINEIKRITKRLLGE